MPLPLRLLLLLALVPILPRSAYAQTGFEVGLEEAFPLLPDLDRPVAIRHAPGGDGRLYVVQQPGLIVSFPNDPSAATLDTLLDIRARVNTQPSWEEGLLGLAFHPDYAENGYVYVHYTTFPEATGQPHRTRIVRFSRSETDSLAADPDSEAVLLELEQPFRWHNGGDLAFGPDGYLYAALGDGGSGGDPLDHAQDRTTLFGSILRLDVDNPADDRLYGIPPDNPFAGNAEGWREEIWAYGLRNPWRFSIDPVTGWLWLGDVGQDTWEEVSVITEPGANLGWDVKEGVVCYTDPDGTDTDEPACDDPALVDPVWTYDRSLGASVTGGYVYRGTAAPELAGQYVFGDFISGRIWGLSLGPGDVVLVRQVAQHALVATFGVDADGELYLGSHDGRLYRFVRRRVSTEPGAESATVFRLDGPNPFQTRTTLAFQPAAPGPVRIAVYDVLGREVAVLYDRDAPAVEQRIALEAAGLPAGMYVVRMEAGPTVRTQKVVLAR